MMILQALSGSSEREADTRAGRWMNHKWMGKDVKRSTLGIIGMGNIGKLGEFLCSSSVSQLTTYYLIFSC